MSPILTLLLIALTYVAILSATTLLSQPLRLRLAELADEIADEPHRSRAEKERLDWLVSSSASSIVGMFLPFAAAYIFVRTAFGAKPFSDPKLRNLENDPRVDKIVLYYMLSVMACSPFAALFALPFVFGTILISVLYGGRYLKQAAEAPILNASIAFQPC